MAGSKRNKQPKNVVVEQETDSTTPVVETQPTEETNTMSEETTNTTATEATADTKRAKKLSKGIEGSVVTITVLGGEKGPMSFDFNDLPEKIQTAFGPFGLGHKLGDSAAGSSGKNAEEAINKVWEGLMAGDWSVRAPAQPKIAISTIASNLANLSPEEKEAAVAALAKLGIVLPA